MADQTFKVGDIVELKSGGPAMTIVSIQDDKYSCTWFYENTRKSDLFKKEIVEKSSKTGKIRL